MADAFLAFFFKSVLLLFAIYGAIFTKPLSLRKNCPYSELFWSAFSRIRRGRDTSYLSEFSFNAGKCKPE